MQVFARKPLSVASYRSCAQRLQPGEVKRVMQRGPLIGYFLACPACGFVGSYVDDAVGYVEKPDKSVTLRVGDPQRELLGTNHPPTCFRCRRLLRVADGHLEACDP